MAVRNDEKRDLIRKEFYSNMTIKEVAEKYGFSKSCVSAYYVGFRDQILQDESIPDLPITKNQLSKWDKKRMEILELLRQRQKA